MLELAHYLLLVAILLLLGRGLQEAAERAGYSTASKKKLIIGYTAFVLLWTVYVIVIGLSGIITTFSLPPRMPIFVILPAFGIIAWFHSARRFKTIRDHFPIELTVYLQSFRIFVELLILGIYYKGIGPQIATFEGQNFDILAGLTAPVIGYLAYYRKVIGAKVVLLWNICCLLLLANIVFIFITQAFFPEFWGYNIPQVSVEFTRPPYLFIAAVFMPFAVFLHMFSIQKTIKLIRAKS